MKRILFIGDLNEYGRSFMRSRAFRDIGCEVRAYSHTKISDRAGRGEKGGVGERILWKLGLPKDGAGANRILEEEAQRGGYEVVWIEKGVMIRKSALRRARELLPKAKFVSFSEDDMAAPHNKSKYYEECLPLYDMLFTTKEYNLKELLAMGAKKTFLTLETYDETLHRPMEMREEDIKKFSAEVSFIGTWEKERADAMLALAEQGIRIVVWGNGWARFGARHKNLEVKNEAVLGEDYVKAINGTKINLCFLRKINRDEITSRSVEIPACGGFMLGERTRRHLEFFREGKEAEFFGSREELIQKIRTYLADEAARKAVGRAGRLRCVENGYGMRTELERLLGAL